MSSSDIIDSQLIVCVQNGKKFVMIYKFSSNIIDWYLKVKLVVFHVFAFPCDDRMLSIDDHGDNSFPIEKTEIFAFAFRSPSIKVMRLTLVDLLKFDLLVLLNLVGTVECSIGKDVLALATDTV